MKVQLEFMQGGKKVKDLNPKAINVLSDGKIWLVVRFMKIRQLTQML